MNTDSPLRSLNLRKSSNPEEDDYTPFANGRVGLRPQLMIIFRKVDGTSHAFAYSHLYSVTTENENAGFTADFGQHRVTVTGRNLEQLYRYICQHRVQAVQEMSERNSLPLDPADPIITQIKVNAVQD